MQVRPKRKPLSIRLRERAALRGATRLFCLSFFALSSLRAAPAQEVPPDAGKPAAATDDRTEIVLYLALRDKKDRPLADLKPADLTVTDSGLPVNSRELKLSSDSHGGDRLITVLFDHLDAAGAKNAARAANRILKNLAELDGAIAVWAIDDRLHIVQSYTPDRALIEKAIGAATGRGNSLATAAAAQERLLSSAEAPGEVAAQNSRQKTWDRSTIAALNYANQARIEQHVPWSIAALAAAAQAQRSMSGRKAILYFTQDVPSNLDAADMFHAASERLRDASIGVYAIDLNALDAHASDGMQAAIAMGTATAASHLNPSPANVSLGAVGSGYQMTPMQTQQMNDTVNDIEMNGLFSGKNLLAQFAESTGGAYASADADPGKLCRRLAGDLIGYSTITYPAPVDRIDGRFHPVVIKIANAGIANAGLKMKLQPGYFALPKASASLPADSGPGRRAVQLQGGGDIERLADAPSGSDLLIRAGVLRFGGAPGAMRGVVALEVPVGPLDLREDRNAGLFSLHATVAAEIKNASGAPVARVEEEFRRHCATDSADKLRTQFLSLEKPVDLPPGDYSLDAIVRDWNTGKIGRTTRAIHLADSDDAAALSDLVLVRSTERKGGADADPLLYGDQGIVPNLSGEVPGLEGSISLYFQLYSQPERSGPEDLRLEVAKDGKTLAALPMARSATGGQERSSRLAHVSLSAPGKYDLTLCLDSAGHAARRHLSVTIPDSAKPEEASQAASETALPANERPTLEFLGLDLKTGLGKALSPSESAALLATARERATMYAKTLPNFLCVETIDRDVDHKGNGEWKRRDSIVEVLRYRDNAETRTVLEINGRKSNIDAGGIEGARSNGEFGGILQTVFNPAAAAEFHWQTSVEKDDQVLQVFNYRVAEKNSRFFVSDHSGTQVRAAFHGLVFIDNDTRAVRRLVAQADEMPASFGVKSSWVTIDYDYIAISGHDYLLPTRGQVGLKQGRHESVANELRFSDYRRFGSTSRMLASTPNAEGRN